MRQRTGETRRCQQCGEDFYVKASEIKKGGGQHCKLACRLEAGSAGKICGTEGCDLPVLCRGMCKSHYERWRRENQSAEEREKESARGKRYYEANREKVLKREQQRLLDDPEGFRRRKAENQRKRRERDPEGERQKSRRAHIKNKYGLTLDEYDAILARGCAICGTHAGRVVGKRNGHAPPPPRLCMDHDHTTGKVRDALCHSCNVALGAFGDDPERMRAAADYIESHQS